MSVKTILYYSKNKYQSPVSLEVGQTIPYALLSENDFICIKIISDFILPSDTYLWLSDFRFDLVFSEIQNENYIYYLNLDSFFESKDQIKFGNIFSIANTKRTFYKIFLNYYGECDLDFEIENEIKHIGKINVESEKIREIESLIDYLIVNEQYYWNTISLTKIEATENQYNNNILWQIRNLEKDLHEFKELIIPNLSDPIGRLVPKFEVQTLKDVSVVSEESLLWLLENITTLEACSSYEENTILILNKHYRVKEILVQELSNDTDIQENQLIHGYIDDVERFLIGTLKSLKFFIKEISKNSDFKSQIYLSYYQRVRNDIENLQNDIYSIKHNINLKIPVSKQHLNLNSANRFSSKQHYYLAYVQIAKWINKSDGILNPQEIFSGTKDISKLYELFCFFKLKECLINDFGYILLKQDYTHNFGDDLFESINKNIGIQNSKSVFSSPNNGATITLYYDCLPENLITVARGTGDYRPDFVIEFSSSDKYYYAILDAKYKKISTVEKHDYRELTFKYLHGIGLKSGGYFPVLGLFIINPIENGGISYYQSRNYSQFKESASLPLIGRVELGTNPIKQNFLYNLLNQLLEISKQL